MPSPRESSRPRDPVQVSCITGGLFTICATRAASCVLPGNSHNPGAKHTNHPNEEHGTAAEAQRGETLPQMAWPQVGGREWSPVAWPPYTES